MDATLPYLRAHGNFGIVDRSIFFCHHKLTAADTLREAMLGVLVSSRTVGEGHGASDGPTHQPSPLSSHDNESSRLSHTHAIFCFLYPANITDRGGWVLLAMLEEACEILPAAS